MKDSLEYPNNKFSTVSGTQQGVNKRYSFHCYETRHMIWPFMPCCFYAFLSSPLLKLLSSLRYTAVTALVKPSWISHSITGLSVISLIRRPTLYCGCICLPVGGSFQLRVDHRSSQPGVEVVWELGRPGQLQELDFFKVLFLASV